MSAHTDDAFLFDTHWNDFRTLFSGTSDGLFLNDTMHQDPPSPISQGFLEERSELHCAALQSAASDITQLGGWSLELDPQLDLYGDTRFPLPDIGALYPLDTAARPASPFYTHAFAIETGLGDGIDLIENNSNSNRWTDEILDWQEYQSSSEPVLLTDEGGNTSSQRRLGQLPRLPIAAKQFLEEMFDRNPYPSPEEIEQFSTRIHINAKRIRNWFGNTRCRREPK
ncbi:hypothetical protein BCR34DRAFT_592895 [Clohesyomyces aquaticus]|uniref:Homeobox domain-containing protein n=1 Tax=Clohesyomyces aquaticus TaxID=1231657 RepID=A0A1Y1YNB6_9PLEO|nr:hypothetical protein BCR34DRAFT_592895 [Clohesyomyces aquaticus]